MNETVKNATGEIAWLSSGDCENEKCLAAISKGLLLHLTPSHRDARAIDQKVHLALSSYHFLTKEDALAALETAWRTARTVYTATDRDREYRRNVPVKVSHEIDLTK